MSASRCDILVQKILRALGDAGGKLHYDTEILAELDAVQLEIARRHAALKGGTTITLVKGMRLYDLAGEVYKLRAIRTPANWDRAMTICTTPAQWDEARMQAHFYANPKFARVYDGRLSLLPVPALSGETLDIEYVRLPAAPMVVGGEPELPPQWDKCLEWGACDRLAAPVPNGAPAWLERYEAEMQRVASDEFNENPGAITTQHWSDGLGF